MEEDGDSELGMMSTRDSQSPDAPPTDEFTWKIENLSSKLTQISLTSDSFVAGGYKWRVVVFPRGHMTDYLGVYLDATDVAELPLGWNRLAHFTFSLVNQFNPQLTVKHDLRHSFNLENPGFGFPAFLHLDHLYDPSRGFLVNDSIIVEVQVDIPKLSVRKLLVRKPAPVEDAASDSDREMEMGYVGLLNQGATCYLNSLLQTLYHLPYFRKAVYLLPKTENDLPSESLPLALQRLFYEMQYGDTTPETVDLSKSFGWDQSWHSSQQDVHEFNRTLCAKLEEKMKGTPADGTIQELFEGHVINMIECIDVDYMSSRTQAFYDLQLDVRGCKDVYDSLDKYVEVEKLEGENQYRADQFGLQDATKRVKFIDFPPVLQLHLKRFDFDSNQGIMVKINDRYEFPLQLDLDREDGKYLSPHSDRSVRNLYTLHSVLVHSGDVDGGHYYAFIRPTLSEQWYKFDDDVVTREEPKTVLEDHCGEDREMPRTSLELNIVPRNSTNAYMLVYIRESYKDKALCSVEQEDIPEHLKSAGLEEEPRKKRKTA